MHLVDNTILSVIVPFYNAEEKIPFLLQSLVNQDTEGVQFIFVDDGSTDNTNNLILKHLENTNINYILSVKSNGGVSSARNLGLNLATSKYIVFIDSDDALLAGALTMIKQLIEEYQDYSLLMLEYIRLKEQCKHDAYDLNVIKNGDLCFDASAALNSYISGELIKKVHVCSCIYKIDFLKDNAIIFDENFSYGEDQKFVLECLAAVKLFVSFEFPILAYIDYETSATGVFNLKWFDSYHIFTSLYFSEKFKCHANSLNNRMNNELIGISNKFILHNNIPASIYFIKDKIIPIKRDIKIPHHSVLFYFPIIYVLLYKLYRKVLTKH